MEHKHYKPNHNSIYKLDEILNVIEYVLITGASWRSIDLAIFDNRYKWQSIYYHFNKFSRLNIFEKIYIEILSFYFKYNKSGKLKYLSSDTSFIKNEYASKTNFGYTGKKRTSKLSLIVDSNGVSISAVISNKGSVSDQKMLLDNLNNMYIDIFYCSDNNKHKRYLLVFTRRADSIYDTNNIRDKIKSLNIHPIIYPNKRSTKDKKKLAEKKLKGRDKKIYRKRIIVEHCFSWLYKNRRINRRYDKKENNYMSFLFLALTKIILKRLAK